MKHRYAIVFTLILATISCRVLKSVGCSDCKVVYGTIQEESGEIAEEAEVYLRWESDSAKGNGFAFLSSDLTQKIDIVTTDIDGNYIIFYQPTKKMNGGRYFLRITTVSGQRYAVRFPYNDNKIVKMDLVLSEDLKYPY